MIAFIDFEASSLDRHGFPVSVGWVSETGTEDSCLIRPAPGWEEWSEEAEAIHHLTRDQLAREGIAVEQVAQSLVAALDGVDLYASAPSWDGKWLSALLRAAGLPRHALRLGSSKDLRRSEAGTMLARAGVAEAALADRVEAILAAAERDVAASGPVTHQALADARRELHLWRAVRRQTEAAVTAQAHPERRARDPNALPVST